MSGPTPTRTRATPLLNSPAAVGQPMLRWQSRAKSIDGIAAELGRIWSAISLTAEGPEGDERRVAARSSGMNLVVIAGRGEVGEGGASIVEGVTGGHPSRAPPVAAAHGAPRRSRRPRLAGRAGPGALRAAVRHRRGDLLGDGLPDLRRR